MAMEHEELAKDIAAVEQELKEKPHRRSKSPVYFVLVPLIVFFMILWIVPSYYVKLNPEPQHIPGFDEVITVTEQELETADANVQDRRAEIRNFLEPNRPEVKQLADRIVSVSGCPVDRTCYAKALFYFVQRNIQYVNDPPDEYIKPFDEIIVSQVGDCDDHAVLLANLLQSIGIHTKFVFIPGHVYVQAYLPDSIRRYHDKKADGWVNLDATCSGCRFAELPQFAVAAERFFV